MNNPTQELIDRYTTLYPEIDYYGYGVYTTEVDTESLVEAVVRECARQCLSDDGMRILLHFGVQA